MSLNRTNVVISLGLLCCAVLFLARQTYSHPVRTGVAADGAWLSGKTANWNVEGAAVPKAPATAADSMLKTSCRAQVRRPASAADQALVRAGWSLYGPVQSFGATSVMMATADADGMCRPLNYQTFVFVGGKFAGTLSPAPMNSRSDGALSDVRLFAEDRLTAQYSRYKPDDALCCPSSTANVSYQIKRGGKGALVVPEIDPSGSAQNSATASQSVVTGTVTYRQRMALPPAAVVQVQLIDASRADAPAEVLATQSIEPKGKQVPIPFSLAYDAGKIQENHDYRVQAKIMVGDRLAFTSTQAYGVITRGKPSNVEVVVEPVRASAGSSGAKLPSAKLEETKWTLTELNGEAAKAGARREFPYFQLNASNKRVAGFSGCNRMTGGYMLTGDQLKFTQMAGTRMACVGEGAAIEPAFLKMLGAVTSYKLTDGNLELYGNGQLLARFQSGQQAATQPGKAGLVNTNWTLTELHGQAVTAKTRNEIGNLRLDANRNQASVFVGCNGMGGTYKLDGDKLKFERLIGTMMFCNEETGKLEKGISDALGAVTSYKLVGNKLELYGNGKLLARLEAKQ